MKKFCLNKGKGIEGPVAQAVIYIIIGITIILVLLPLFITINLSLKSNFEMLRPIWELPKDPLWSNYAVGFSGMAQNLFNAIVVATVSTALLLFISSLVSYAFVRFRFPGKEILFNFIICLMLFPSILSLTPQYVLFIDLGLKNSWLSLIIPYTVGGTVGAIFLMRTFMGQQPASLFEAAKIDGASEWKMYTRITMPLSVPILVLQGIGSFTGIYNDYMWPSMIIDQKETQMLMPVLKNLAQSIVGSYGETGISYALYLMSGIPLVIVILFGLKYLVSGEFASGMKL